MRVELILNGRATALDVRTDEMLLTTLRREHLRSVRETCAIGSCGACTVLLDGEPVSGCLTLTAQAAGREVTTIEGLDGDRMQRAFAETHGFQCGWCTPGFILMARRLLELNPSPSDPEIADAFGGNLCRCGSYVKVVEAVRRCGS